MFTTTESVKDLTTYEVTTEVINAAQSIIEAYVGKVEAEIDDPNDLMLLGKATAYQAAYMRDNMQLVFEQVKASQIGSLGQIMSFSDDVSPFVAPLAILACKKVSWNRSRSIHTGRMYQTGPVLDRWLYE